MMASDEYGRRYGKYEITEKISYLEVKDSGEKNVAELIPLRTKAFAVLVV